MKKAKAVRVLDQFDGKNFVAYHGDCVDVLRGLPDDSIHYSIFSPPFASLYTYSASDRDMGNVKDAAEFAEHFSFLIPELLRVIKPGRLVSMHVMNLPTSKARDGEIGILDFRGELIRAFVNAGWIFHSEVCIWKDPVTAMQRTKALGLLHKQIKKDSCMSRQGIPDFLVTFRKPGDNPERVTHTDETFPVAVWQRYASPVWMDIDPSRTLQYASAREHDDERHICPLQLDVIERAMDLWTNPGDVVLSPFMGIGSEGFVAIQKGRKFVGAELKESYFQQASRNLASVAPTVSLYGILGLREGGESAPVAPETIDAERVAELESALAEANVAHSEERAELERQIADLKQDLLEAESDDTEEKSEPNPYKVAAAFHNLMRDEGFIRDADRDVPFGSTLTNWRHKLETTAEEALQ